MNRPIVGRDGRIQSALPARRVSIAACWASTGLCMFSLNPPARVGSKWVSKPSGVSWIGTTPSSSAWSRKFSTLPCS